MRFHLRAAIVAMLCIAVIVCHSQPANNFTVTAYYFGGPEKVDSLAVEKLTHIIFSFCHLAGNKLTVDDEKDSQSIKKLVAAKKRNSSLKVLLSLGGWGGCKTCSDVFSSAEGRKEFSQSVLDLNKFYGTDGIDLDWEYPAVEGYPDHAFKPADKQNFTALLRELRSTLGNKYEITFAAGGFQEFLDDAVEWKEVMSIVDRVNLMTYDLVNGNSVVTGHHTGLYSSPEQHESTDNAVQYLIKLGIPPSKLVIGAAFYGRVWENVAATKNGLYQSGKFKKGVNYKDFEKEISSVQGFTSYWDDVVKAPYAYNAKEKFFVTYDDKRSMDLKAKYVVDQRLNGIMFWELTHDTYKDGLLQTIDNVKKNYKGSR
ncbi:MAG TPA: glycoside hydrolase family 18 protein [Chryseolinea sp.]|nr:glycoside hydrolase family 18 protein [Chryseolinea sp.]